MHNYTYTNLLTWFYKHFVEVKHYNTLIYNCLCIG